MMLREGIVTQCANNALHAFVAGSNQFEYGKNSFSVARALETCILHF
jgi:hypothetical protein